MKCCFHTGHIAYTDDLVADQVWKRSHSSLIRMESTADRRIEDCAFIELIRRMLVSSDEYHFTQLGFILLNT